MRLILLLGIGLVLLACKEKATERLTAQQIIDRAIDRAGGDLYGCSHIDFVFRDRLYSLEYEDRRKILKRSFELDSSRVVDIKRNDSFERTIDNRTVSVPDTTARKFSNSINSVHYFAYLPYGLNDQAVNKKLLGERKIKGEEYYVIEITFDQVGGGDDFDDIYIYWIHKQHFTPNYLAYEFHVNGGGMRFREALNERYVEGIRFVDYSNYKPKEIASIYEIDRLYQQDKLALLSTIELEEIRVNVDNCN
ncbi:MAG: DUF6503 family protein [Flavobacteriaceae bacterium]